MIISCIVQISHVVILYFPELELLENEYVQRIWFRLRLKRYSHRKWRNIQKKPLFPWETYLNIANEMQPSRAPQV